MHPCVIIIVQSAMSDSYYMCMHLLWSAPVFPIFCHTSSSNHFKSQPMNWVTDIVRAPHGSLPHIRLDLSRNSLHQILSSSIRSLSLFCAHLVPFRSWSIELGWIMDVRGSPRLGTWGSREPKALPDPVAWKKMQLFPTLEKAGNLN